MAKRAWMRKPAREHFEEIIVPTPWNGREFCRGTWNRVWRYMQLQSRCSQPQGKKFLARIKEDMTKVARVENLTLCIVTGKAGAESEGVIQAKISAR